MNAKRFDDFTWAVLRVAASIGLFIVALVLMAITGIAIWVLGFCELLEALGCWLERASKRPNQ